MPPLDIGVFGARGIPSTYSGYETFLTVLLPELAVRGHRVTMYCRRGEAGAAAGDYLDVRRVVLPSIRSKQLDTLSHGSVAAVWARFARHQVVLAVNVANVPFGFLLRATGQPVVINTDGQEWLRGKWGRAARRYFRFSAATARYGASALVADSEGMREVYRREFAADSTVIPYCWTGIGAGERADVLSSLGLGSRRYLLVAGRLNPENNIEHVVDAYVRSGVTAPLVVLGAANYDSPVERRLREVAAGHPGVRIGGHVADRDAYATLVRHASLYLHAHSVGGINPSLVEAMGCGALIAALDTVFNHEALGDAGLYFADFDDQLPRLLASFDAGADADADAPGAGDAYEQLRDRARERVEERFDLRRVADAYEDLLVEVAARHAWCTTTRPTVWRSSGERSVAP